MNIANKKPLLQIDWGFFRDIPIGDVAETLGIEVNNKGFFKCPSHNDRKPSAQIRPRTNTWCCYTCGHGTGGSPIDLVMASEGVGALDAVKFLNQYFPGGIKEVQSAQEESVEIPYISPEMLKNIGLRRNPFLEHHVKMLQNVDESGKAEFDKKDIQLAYIDAAELVIEKLVEYRDAKRQYAEGVLKEFPELDIDAKMCIRSATSKKVAEAEALLELFREFVAQNSSLENKTPWAEEYEKDA